MSVLAGIRVVELANERIAFAGKLLADMGADVILIEPPDGDSSRDYPPFLDDTPGPNRSLYFWHYPLFICVTLQLHQVTENRERNHQGWVEVRPRDSSDAQWFEHQRRSRHEEGSLGVAVVRS